MSLLGVGDDPTPAIRREIIFAQGDTLGAGSERFVLFYGNKTSAGSDTDEVLGPAVGGDQDMRDRFGARSELYQMWRAYSAVDTGATLFALPVTEASGGKSGLAFLSTHPSGPQRIRELEQNVPKVQGLYDAARGRG